MVSVDSPWSTTIDGIRAGFVVLAVPRFGHGLLSYYLPAALLLLTGCGSAGSAAFAPPVAQPGSGLAAGSTQGRAADELLIGGGRRRGTPPPAARIGNCPVMPLNNAWNTDVSAAPIDAHSADYLAAMNAATKTLSLDFPAPGAGIPVNVVNEQPAQYAPITFTLYAAESDPGPYPIPAHPLVQTENGDHHMIVVNTATCDLYETWATQIAASGAVSAGAGAHFSLLSNALRPDGWTSADAAGLPIFPGLVKYDEVAAGAMNHALRFSMSATAARHIAPATHHAGSSTAAYAPPMGLRVRLKASFDLSGFTGQNLVIAQSLQKYGMILADNGGDFAISGTEDARWNSDGLNPLRGIPASALEVVDAPAP
jgi:hypothetical protein